MSQKFLGAGKTKDINRVNHVV